MTITNALISTGNLKLVLSCFQGVENAYMYYESIFSQCFLLIVFQWNTISIHHRKAANSDEWFG